MNNRHSTVITVTALNIAAYGMMLLVHVAAFHVPDMMADKKNVAKLTEISIIET